MSKQVGLTLAELMVTLLVAAILVAVAAPSISSVVQNNRAISLTSELTAMLHLAHAEAIRRGVAVSVCAASDTNQSACSSTATWNNGWLVFVDADANGSLATANDRIKVQQALAAGQSITTSRAFVTYSAEGIVETGVSVFTITAEGCTANNARQVTLSSAGRISVRAIAC
jgi:type IV fimbrial biogenesis protein FimT